MASKVNKVYCKVCDKNISKNKYKGHLRTKRHIENETGESQFKNNNKIKCDICDCMILRNSLAKHKLTKKHINNEAGNKKVKPKTTYCKVCDKNISTVNITTHNKTKKHKKNILKNKPEYIHIKSIINKIKDILPNKEIQKEGDNYLKLILNENDIDEDNYRIYTLLTHYIDDNGDLFY